MHIIRCGQYSLRQETAATPTRRDDNNRAALPNVIDARSARRYRVL